MTTELNTPVASHAGPSPATAPAATEIRGQAPVEATAAPSTISVVDRAVSWWPLFALIASAAMLGAAHAFETFSKMAPCNLCLKQREVYWVAGTVALIAIAASRSPWAQKARRPFNLLLAAIFLYGAGLAAFHTGVEWKWWPGPTSCAAGGSAAVAGDLVAMLKGGKVKAPSCDTAAWVFLGLSMAGWNALASLGLAVASLAAGLRKPVEATR